MVLTSRPTSPMRIRSLSSSLPYLRALRLGHASLSRYNIHHYHSFRHRRRRRHLSPRYGHSIIITTHGVTVHECSLFNRTFGCSSPTSAVQHCGQVLHDTTDKFRTTMPDIQLRTSYGNMRGSYLRSLIVGILIRLKGHLPDRSVNNRSLWYITSPSKHHRALYIYRSAATFISATMSSSIPLFAEFNADLNKMVDDVASDVAKMSPPPPLQHRGDGQLVRPSSFKQRQQRQKRPHQHHTERNTWPKQLPSQDPVSDDDSNDNANNDGIGASIPFASTSTPPPPPLPSPSPAPAPSPMPSTTASSSISSSAHRRTTSKKGQLQRKTRLQRPRAIGQYYTTTEAKWQTLPAARQRILTHVGRIEETVNGLEAQDRCEECVAHNVRCMVYSSYGRSEWHSSGGFTCAHCRFIGTSCQFARSAVAPTTRLSLRQQLDNALARIVLLETEIAFLRIERGTD